MSALIQSLFHPESELNEFQPLESVRSPVSVPPGVRMAATPPGSDV